MIDIGKDAIGSSRVFPAIKSKPQKLCTWSPHLLIAWAQQMSNLCNSQNRKVLNQVNTIAQFHEMVGGYFWGSSPARFSQILSNPVEMVCIWGSSEAGRAEWGF